MKKVIDNVEIDLNEDYYEILGVDKNATTSEILKKGSSLLSYFSSSDNQVFTGEREKYEASMNILKAMNILGKPEIRKIYDEERMEYISENDVDVNINDIVKEAIEESINDKDEIDINNFEFLDLEVETTETQDENKTTDDVDIVDTKNVDEEKIAVVDSQEDNRVSKVAREEIQKHKVFYMVLLYI